MEEMQEFLGLRMVELFKHEPFVFKQSKRGKLKVQLI
jgi:hypothetical protein